MRREVEMVVHGIPAPQGSKRHVGRGIMVESSKKVGPWRDAVRTECQRVVEYPTTGAVSLELEFLFSRPRGHYGTGKNSGRLKEWAQYAPHTVRPDLDKLIRSTADGLRDGGMYADDSQVVEVSAMKRYVREDEATGVRIKAILLDV